MNNNFHQALFFASGVLGLLSQLVGLEIYRFPMGQVMFSAVMASRSNNVKALEKDQLRYLLAGWGVCQALMLSVGDAFANSVLVVMTGGAMVYIVLNVVLFTDSLCRWWDNWDKRGWRLVSLIFGLVTGLLGLATHINYLSSPCHSQLAIAALSFFGLGFIGTMWVGYVPLLYSGLFVLYSTMPYLQAPCEPPPIQILTGEQLLILFVIGRTAMYALEDSTYGVVSISVARFKANLNMLFHFVLCLAMCYVSASFSQWHALRAEVAQTLDTFAMIATASSYTGGMLALRYYSRKLPKIDTAHLA